MKKTNKVKIYSTILAILVVFILIFNQVLLKLKSNIDRIFIPIQAKIYTNASKIGDAKNIFFQYKNLIKENDELKKEIAELKYQNDTYKDILEENKRLTELLKVKENEKIKSNLKFARVIFQNSSNLNRKFYINLGLNDEIEKDMIVMSNNYLVGRVTEVYSTYSMVTMITDSRTTISVRTEDDILGLLQGNENADGTMYFNPSASEENLKENQEVYTSGISDIYPAGIKVGKILKIDGAENNIFKRIKIEAGFKSEDLREVMLYKRNNILQNKANKKEKK